MKVYKVIVNRNIVYDGVLRKIGDEIFMVDEEKVKYFERKGYIKVVEVITDEVEKIDVGVSTKKKTKRKKRTKEDK